MKVRAPGKILLAGAYAVLEGAPALVMAVDRYAVADGSLRAARPTPEVLAAMTSDEAPEVDAASLRSGDSKLGLGSSAAMLVASLGVRFAAGGADLRTPAVRDALFERARASHARVQNGGSGVDIAASVYGGALAYTLLPGHPPKREPLSLPRDVEIEVYWCGEPATTMRMRERVDALRIRDARLHARRLETVASASREMIDAARRDDSAGFVAGACRSANGLLALGKDADAPVVPPGLVPLVALAEREGFAFSPSGAGGGDVFVLIGIVGATSSLRSSARAAGLSVLPMRIDLDGVSLSS
jgi:phosphomevalonate kinase